MKTLILQAWVKSRNLVSACSFATLTIIILGLFGRGLFSISLVSSRPPWLLSTLNLGSLASSVIFANATLADGWRPLRKTPRLKRASFLTWILCNALSMAYLLLLYGYLSWSSSNNNSNFPLSPCIAFFLLSSGISYIMVLAFNRILGTVVAVVAIVITILFEQSTADSSIIAGAHHSGPLLTPLVFFVGGGVVSYFRCGEPAMGDK